MQGGAGYSGVILCAGAAVGTLGSFPLKLSETYAVNMKHEGQQTASAFDFDGVENGEGPR